MSELIDKEGAWYLTWKLVLLQDYALSFDDIELLVQQGLLKIGDLKISQKALQFLEKGKK